MERSGFARPTLKAVMIGRSDTQRARNLLCRNFADDTGDDVDWTRDTAISSITVPAATGNPTPTYVASVLPAGISFNTSTRVISGTPTSSGSGTITITASNSQGSDTWTVDYEIATEGNLWISGNIPNQIYQRLNGGLANWYCWPHWTDIY